MISKVKFGVLAGVLAVSVGAGVALAAMSADDTIKARKACMKANSTALGMAFKMAKGEVAYDAAAFKAVADAQGAACKDWANFWGVDTQKGTTEKTHALPAIWSDPKGFESAGNAAYAAEQKLFAATNIDEIKAALPAVGDGCKGCHEKFRAPLQ